MKKMSLILFISSSMLFATTRIFTLCEGNFGTPNASLWSMNESSSQSEGPIYWDENSNPLGDVGQSMTIVNHEKLYMIMNNSHSIEILNLMGSNQTFSGSIPLPSAAPRYMVANESGSTAYVSCWNLSGIIVIDLLTDTITDTISVGGMPEMMVMHDGNIYTSIAMNSDWSSSDRVIRVDVTTKTVVDSFTVIPGPAALLLKDDFLFVASTYYDANWNTFAGNSKIDLSTGNVLTYDAGMTFDYGSDLVQVNDDIYRIYTNGIAPLNDDLSINIDSKIGDFPGLYSVSTQDDKIYFGSTDYTAPDHVYVTDADGIIISEYTVGALPGSFAFYQYNIESVNQDASPTTFTLMANYPNPFNPSTHIQFSIETQTNVSLMVFDIHGVLIESLIDNRIFNTGLHTINWNAHHFPSGIYFAVLNIEGQSQIQKMSLVK
ncbi:MAG: T9SS type A sorting domain-containing protein [Candidatus Marinimicrobia bacterium]|nr:T9SS type A sorting domain-containing protein [Candidatus Neomarinimicrobiota bacterium]